MTRYKNIILDLGGVVLDIDYNKTRDAFINLGFRNFETVYSQLRQENVFDLFETGKMPEGEFRTSIRNFSGQNFSDAEIDCAWNAMILSLPESRSQFLAELKSRYRMFLLSNTNSIHEKEFTKKIFNAYKKNVLEEQFERVYYSHHVGVRKPQPEIFEMVIGENNLDKAETIFIDDSPQHIAGAKHIGLNAIHLQEGIKLENVLMQF
jgi:glucose-1-phosphatase